MYVLGTFIVIRYLCRQMYVSRNSVLQGVAKQLSGSAVSIVFHVQILTTPSAEYSDYVLWCQRPPYLCYLFCNFFLFLGDVNRFSFVIV